MKRILSTAVVALTLVACESQPAPATPAAAPARSPRAVLVVITNVSRYATVDRPTGYWVAEVAQPAALFESKGIRVDFASIKGGPVPIDPSSDPRNPQGHAGQDPVSLGFLGDARVQERLARTARLADVNLSAYDAIFFAGGTGAAFDFPGDTSVQGAARSMFERGKVVAAVCHGTAALVDVKLSDGSFLLRGRKATGFSNKEEEMAGNLKGTLPFSIEDEMGKRGALYSAGAPWQPNAVRDGRLITGQQPQSARAMAEAVAAAIGD